MSLTQRFAATAGIVVLAACVGLALYSGERAKRDIVVAAEGYNITLARLLARTLWDKHRAYLQSEVTADESGHRLSLLDIRLSTLDDDVRGLLAGSPIAKIKLYTTGGRTAYSTSHAEIGADKSGNAGFRAAVGGGSSSALHFKDTFNAFDGEKTERDVLETYLPVRGEAGVEGVIEVYHDLTPILAQMRAAQHEQWAVVGATMALLLVLLILLVWRSERAVTRARDAVALAQREADEAQLRERMKSEFLANISHELRSPMNAILGFAQVMQDKVFGPIAPQRYESYVDDIVDSGGYLLRTIDDILDMARIEARQIELLPTAVDLGDLLHRCVRQVGHAQRRPDVELSAHVPEPIRLFADENRLRQAFCNVIANGVKFIRGAGTVTVTAMRGADGGVAIVVRDTGIGIPAGKLRSILTPFGQVAGAYARATGGIGLGLPIANALIDMHGGGLEIESAPGAGTAVTFTLPAARVIGADGAVQTRAA